MVPQFETCGQRDSPLVLRTADIFSLKTKEIPRALFESPFNAHSFFHYHELSTGSVHCAPDDDDRPSEQIHL